MIKLNTITITTTTTIIIIIINGDLIMSPSGPCQFYNDGEYRKINTRREGTLLFNVTPFNYRVR